MRKNKLLHSSYLMILWCQLFQHTELNGGINFNKILQVIMSNFAQKPSDHFIMLNKVLGSKLPKRNSILSLETSSKVTNISKHSYKSMKSSQITTS